MAMLEASKEMARLDGRGFKIGQPHRRGFESGFSDPTAGEVDGYYFTVGDLSRRLNE